MYNEICCAIFEKTTILDATERFVFQSSETLRAGDKSYLCPQKDPCDDAQKAVYVEHLVFLIKKARWQVTKSYSHYTFEQERFKRDFILMNQHSRQNAKNSVEKDFFKLSNNMNFGYDCRSNLDNCIFEPICEEIDKIAYI